MRTTIITALLLCATEFLTIVLASPMAKPSLVLRFLPEDIRAAAKDHPEPPKWKQMIAHILFAIFLLTFILRAIANRNNDLQSAVFDGGAALCAAKRFVYTPSAKATMVALAAVAQPAKHNILCFAIEGSISAASCFWDSTD